MGHNSARFDLSEKEEDIISLFHRFKGIGEIAVQHDAGHTALPWATVRLVLQVRWRYPFQIFTIWIYSWCDKHRRSGRKSLTLHPVLPHTTQPTYHTHTFNNHIMNIPTRSTTTSSSYPHVQQPHHQHSHTFNNHTHCFVLFYFVLFCFVLFCLFCFIVE